MPRSTAAPAKRGVARDPGPPPLAYTLLRAPVRRALERWFALSVEGLEHLPPRGPYIIAANHHNYLDGVVLAAALPVAVRFLVMPRVWSATPLHPLFHRHVGSIALEVGRPDVGALRRALAALEAGEILGIFPEGPYSVCGRLERGLPGVALLALRSSAPVVPVGISGTYEALRGRRFYLPRRHPLAVRVGAARHFPEEADGVRSTRAEVTARIMADIAALLA